MQRSRTPRLASLVLPLTLLALAVSASGGAAPASAAFGGSWADRALDLQYDLAGDVPLRDAPLIGTHNSFNSVAEMGRTISTLDPNQQLSLTDQLNRDVRALELDVHWTESPGTGTLEPLVCHAFPSHFPCTAEKTLGQVLGEVAAWLAQPENSGEALFIYLEDHLDNAAGYDAAAAAIEATLGGLVYRPAPGGGCQRLPLGLTRDGMLAAGKRVILVGNSPCGVGEAWPSLVFDWEEHLETRLRSFSDFPACGDDYTRAQFDATQVRYYDDERPSQLGAPRITAAIAAQMARCGVDLLGLDQLAPQDPRLAALVWSWAPGQPRRGRCAVQGASRRSKATRWRTLACGKRRRPACRRGKHWLLGRRAVPERRGRASCRARRARFAVPRTGYEAQLLRRAMLRARVGQAWLGYVRRSGVWTALDPRRS